MKYLTLEYHLADDFRKFVLLSACLHLSLFIILTTKSFLRPSNIIEVPNSIRVDLVALPDKMPDVMAPEPPAPAPTHASANKPANTKAPAPVEAAENKIDLKATQKKALEKLQATSAIEKLKKELREKATSQQGAATTQAQPVPTYKGNIISSGNSFTGLSKLRVNEYLQNLTASVRNHWVLPQWLSSTNLKASVVISIDERGYVVKREIHTSSGNEVFDSSCLAAVEASSPFAVPPSEVRDALIMIRFPFE